MTTFFAIQGVTLENSWTAAEQQLPEQFTVCLHSDLQLDKVWEYLPLFRPSELNT